MLRRGCFPTLGKPEPAPTDATEQVAPQPLAYEVSPQGGHDGAWPSKTQNQPPYITPEEALLGQPAVARRRERALTMVSSSQPTKPTRLILVHQWHPL